MNLNLTKKFFQNSWLELELKNLNLNLWPSRSKNWFFLYKRYKIKKEHFSRVKTVKKHDFMRSFGRFSTLKRDILMFWDGKNHFFIIKNFFYVEYDFFKAPIQIFHAKLLRKHLYIYVPIKFFFTNFQNDPLLLR